jgi:hypothetical protein
LNRQTSGDAIQHVLTKEGLATLKQARDDFSAAHEECVKLVQASIIKHCGTPRAADQYDLPKIIEEYLCAIFSEIRLGLLRRIVQRTLGSRIQGQNGVKSLRIP